MIDVTPIDAFAAVLNDEGEILVDEASLADPDLRPVVILKFKTGSPMNEIDGKLQWTSQFEHQAIYHPEADMFEFHELDKIVVEKEDPALYQIGLGVINHFKDKLLDGPAGRKLKEYASKEAIADMLAWTNPQELQALANEIKSVTVQRLSERTGHGFPVRPAGVFKSRIKTSY